MSQLEGNRFFRQIYLILTHKCPLNCEYCYIDRGSKFEDMEWETIKRTMEVVRPTIKGGRGIVFFGGEPLLRVDLIERTVKEYADKIPGGIGGVVTSATVNMDKFFPIYRDYGLDLQISYDGFAHSKSRHNKFDFGALQPYFELEDKRFQLRKTVSDCNIDTLFEDYKFGRDLHFKHNISFDYAVAHQKSFGEDFWNKFYKHQVDIWDFIYNTIVHEEKTYVPLTLMRDLVHVIDYIGSANPPPRIDSCEIGHILVVDGDGSCFPCTMLSQLGEEFKIGNVNGEIDFDKGSCYSKPLNCNCPYSIVCGGGCRWERYHKFGKDDSGNNKITSTCKMLHIKYQTANKFFRDLPDEQKELMIMAIKRYTQYQKLTFDLGMYSQAHKLGQQAVKDIEQYGLISWR